MSASTVIVVPVFNGMPQLGECLASLRWAAAAGVRVLVVDSGSTDGSLEVVDGAGGWASVLHGAPWMWWTAAVDAGCRSAIGAMGADRLVLLNHDCTWTEESFARFADCMDRRPNDIVCSRVLSVGDGRVAFAGGIRHASGMLDIRGFEAEPETSFPAGPVVWCGGMGVGFDRRVYEAVGGFDAVAFPHYYGDSDFCLRAAARGYRVWFCPESTVVNDAASSGIDLPREVARVRDAVRALVSRHSFWNVRDVLRFYARHAGPSAPLAVLHVYGLYAAIALTRISRPRATR